MIPGEDGSTTLLRSMGAIVDGLDETDPDCKALLERVTVLFCGSDD